MKQLHKNKWLLIGLILITIFSSLGSSVSVIAETVDSSAVETSDTLDEQKLPSDMEVEDEEIPIVESDAQEKVTEDSQVDNETESLESSESQSQTKDWSPGTSIQTEAVRNWVSQQLDSYFNLSNEKLGENVGDKIVKTINFPDYMGIAAYKGEGNWNGQWHIQLGKTRLDSSGYFKFSNFSFTHSSDISVSLSGSDTDKTRTLTITRLKQSTYEKYSIKANYYFDSRGVMYNDFGLISGTYNTINPNGDGKQIDMKLEAQIKEVQITAEANPQKISIGTNEKSWDLKTFVKNVKRNGEILEADKYSVNIIANIDTNIKGTKNITLQIEDKETGKKSKDIVVPVTIDKYNTFIFKGMASQTVMSLSLINENENLYLQGNRYYAGDFFDGRIHYGTANNEYLNVQVMKDVPDDTVFPSSYSPQVKISYKGNDSLDSAYSKINQLEVKEGDIVRIFHKEGKYGGGKLLELYKQGNKQTIQNDMAITGYYQVTKSGFEPIYVDKLSTNKQLIQLGMSNSELDNLLPNTINSKENPNISVDKYKTRPNSNLIGVQNTEVIVNEKLKSGNRIKSFYNVSFEVKPWNTIKLYGWGYMDVLGLSIRNEKNQLSLVSSQLTMSKSQSLIHKDFEEKVFYQVQLYSPTKDIVNLENEESYYNQFWLGGDNSLDAYSKFKEQTIKQGDVIYLYHEQGDYKISSNNINMVERYHSGVKQNDEPSKKNYYEMTSSGFSPIFLYNLSTNSQEISKDTTDEELNANLTNYINTLGKQNIKIVGFADGGYPDRTTEGKKVGKVIVQEDLSSGKKLETVYEVPFTVNPKVEESSYDEKGQPLTEIIQTEFNYGMTFTPKPSKYLKNDNNLYTYKGWLSDSQVPGTDNPIKGKPTTTTKSKKYYYIYEKADKYINVTIPTEMVFGTFDNTEEVKSNKYEIKNNSKELTTNVSLESFREVKTAVKLLEENEAPDEAKDSARLNLLINDEPKIKGLNEKKIDISLADIEPEDTAKMGINGEYYAKTSQINIVKYNTILKFKAILGK